ncbi:MAG TPA: T9SS type A sorting domain-containing protein [Ignavibacteriales bacterium]|nr:T9SS type A sorting domain-containing protein [Ignavibacteriales bacterium]
MVKNKILISFFVIVPVLLLLSFQRASAQSLTIKLEGRSPAQLGLNESSKVWPVSSGLRVVAVGKSVYVSADTTMERDSTTKPPVITWALTAKPTGSTATLDSTGTNGNSFMADVRGLYTVTATLGSKTATKNIFASVYKGITLTKNCAPCHLTPRTVDKFPQWSQSAHATMYKRGITGQLHGTYGTDCAKCHTTGWDSTLNNGNFAYRSKITGWDTAWYKPGTLTNNTIQITPGDSSRWVKLETQYPGVDSVANIGCEQCHGPATDHAAAADTSKIAVSLQGSVCNVCHDLPPGYPVGGEWRQSKHATMPLSGAEAGRTSCYPCHSGSAIVKFAKNKANPGYNAQDNFPSIACASCHDPHQSTNTTFSVRLLSLDSLVNGYKPQTPTGTGSMCMNCHHARVNSQTTVTNQAKKFSDRFYPHYSPQSDMYLGANGYEYGMNFTGEGTHKNIMPNACVSCHMVANPDTSANRFGAANHYMSMTDQNGNDRVYVCKPCHPSVNTSFEDVIASSDYDKNGKIEGVQIEIQGLLDQLKAKLPTDTTGEVVTRASDSMKVKNFPGYPKILGPMWDYYFVKNDWSKGVHNSKYAVSLLQASLQQLTGVEMKDNITPKTYSLAQNYPNPFNPATTIEFSVPENADVTLVVYDAVGRQVGILHSGILKTGNYKVVWNPGNIASGVYYYKLSSVNYSLVKKMVFLK